MKSLKFGYIELTSNGDPVPVNVRAIMSVNPRACKPCFNKEDEEKAMITFLDSSYMVYDENWLDVQKLILERVS